MVDGTSTPKGTMRIMPEGMVTDYNQDKREKEFITFDQRVEERFEG